MELRLCYANGTIADIILREREGSFVAIANAENGREKGLARIRTRV
jgi:hypothetical protein